jgi:integrase
LKEVGDVDHLKVFATEEAAERWFAENNPEGVAFVYPVLTGLIACLTLASQLRCANDQIKMPDLAFHNLRHTHASQLIDAGVDIVTISKRLGHAKPDITLRIYAHLFQKDDGKAAAAINASLNR